MENLKPQRFSDITEEMKRDWKAKHGKYALRELSIPIDYDEEKKPTVFANYIVALPNRNVIMACAACDSETTEGQKKAAHILIENCVLGGDMEALEQYFSVFANISQYLSEMSMPNKVYQEKKI